MKSPLVRTPALFLFLTSIYIHTGTPATNVSSCLVPFSYTHVSGVPNLLTNLLLVFINFPIPDL